MHGECLLAGSGASVHFDVLSVPDALLVLQENHRFPKDGRAVRFPIVVQSEKDGRNQEWTDVFLLDLAIRVLEGFRPDQEIGFEDRLAGGIENVSTRLSAVHRLWFSLLPSEIPFITGKSRKIL
jgi:hypothetical protein